MGLTKNAKSVSKDKILKKCRNKETFTSEEYSYIADFFKEHEKCSSKGVESSANYDSDSNDFFGGANKKLGADYGLMEVDKKESKNSFESSWDKLLDIPDNVGFEKPENIKRKNSSEKILDKQEESISRRISFNSDKDGDGKLSDVEKSENRKKRKTSVETQDKLGKFSDNDEDNKEKFSDVDSISEKSSLKSEEKGKRTKRSLKKIEYFEDSKDKEDESSTSKRRKKSIDKKSNKSDSSQSKKKSASKRKTTKKSKAADESDDEEVSSLKDDGSTKSKKQRNNNKPKKNGEGATFSESSDDDQESKIDKLLENMDKDDKPESGEKSEFDLFTERRNFITEEDPTVLDIKEKYPDLFQRNMVFMEFEFITEKSNLFEIFKENVSRYAEEINSTVKSKSLNEIVSSLSEDADEEKKNWLKDVSSLMLLAKYMGDDRKGIIILDNEELPDGHDNRPYIQCEGDIKCCLRDDSSFKIHVEDTELCTVSNLIEAYYALMASYYIFNAVYPECCENTFYCLERLYIDFSDGSVKLKSKVSKLISSLAKSAKKNKK